MNDSGPQESLYGNEPSAVVKGPGLLDQITGVFMEPVALFKRLAVTPVWGAAFALILVANAVVTAIWALRVDADAMFRPILERDARIPAERIDSIIAIQSKFLLPGGLVGGMVALSLVCLLCAFIYWLIGKGTAEQHPPTYKQAFSGTVVSGLVGLPKFLLLGIICALRNIGGARPDALSPTALGFYLAPDSVKLHAFYNTLDLFTLASLAMLYLATRHTLRLKPLGAFLCVAISAVFMIVLPVWGAR